MDQQESIVLWRQGKDAWNAWAKDMLAKKAALEKTGAWKVDYRGEGQNDNARRAKSV
jgi:hypothetical protein